MILGHWPIYYSKGWSDRNRLTGDSQSVSKCAQEIRRTVSQFLNGKRAREIGRTTRPDFTIVYSRFGDCPASAMNWLSYGHRTGFFYTSLVKVLVKVSTGLAFLLNPHWALGSFRARALRSSLPPAESPPGWGRSSGPRGARNLKDSREGVVQLQPTTFVEFGEATMSAASAHPCDETAVAVLLGTPKLSPRPCFLAREICAATAP